MNKKVLIIGGVALIFIIGIILIVIAFTSRKKVAPKSSKVTLTYWHYEDDKDAFQPIIDAYQKQNSNVTINYVKPSTESQEDYQNKLNNALASGQGPDIFSIKNTWFPQNSKKISPTPKTVMSVDDFKKAFLSVTQKELILKDNGTDAIFGIPLRVDALTMFINTDLFGKAEINDMPTTWNTFIEDVKKITKKRGNQIDQSATALGTTDNVPYFFDILSLLMLQNKTTMVSQNQEQALFNTAIQDNNNKTYYPGTSALDFYTSFARPQKPVYTWNASLENARESFVQGKTAIFFGYSTDIPVIQKQAPNLRFRIAPVPQTKEGEDIYYVNFWTETVAKQGQNQEEAWKFLKFASATDQLNTYYQKKDNLVPSSRNDLSQTQESNELIGTIIKEAKSANAQTWYVGDYFKMEKIFKKMINSVISGQAPQGTIDVAANEATQLLINTKKGQ